MDARALSFIVAINLAVIFCFVSFRFFSFLLQTEFYANFSCGRSWNYIYIDFTGLGPGVYLYAFLIWTTDFEGPFRRERVGQVHVDP